MTNNGIPRATMGRLPAYLSLLKKLPKDTGYISATAIARALSLGEVQVRKDLSAVCGEGKPKIGYAVSALSDCISRALGGESDCEAVIVGAGRQGLALLEFPGFSEYGINIRRAFDIRVEGKPDGVLPLSDLPFYCNMHRVQIGILAVPPSAAQETADLLIRCGIGALWCFAPVRLTTPPGVTVQYENLALSLAHLHQKMKNTQRT